MMKKVIALVLCGLVALVLAAGCEGFGLGGEGGAGGEVPACNDVLIGPPVTPGSGGSGGDIGADGSGGDIGADGSGGDGGSTPGDADSQTCMDGSELGTYIRCKNINPATCMEMCADIGATCAAGRKHAYKPALPTGMLKQCMSNTTGHTCTYCYSNGDVCTFVFPGGWAMCSYTGGKGCE